MPTYTFGCTKCGALRDVVMSMSAYVAHPPVFSCIDCGHPMQRWFATAPELAMVSEAHYDGLRAPDGADISTRAKHREYMKRNNLTTVDDYRDTWAKAAREREGILAGQDASRAQDIANAIHKLGG